MNYDELMLNSFHCVLLIIWGNPLCDVHLPSCELVVNVLLLFISNYTQNKNSAGDSLFGRGNRIGNF
jgi:hypothetical protein